MVTELAASEAGIVGAHRRFNHRDITRLTGYDDCWLIWRRHAVDSALLCEGARARLCEWSHRVQKSFLSA